MSQVDQKRVALAALCDDRSVAKYLRGEKVRPMLRERIEKALRELGMGELVRAGAVG